MNKDKVRELTEDYIFKRVFGKKENEDLLKDLLESILEIKIAQIEVIIGTEIEKEKIEDKLGIIDLKATINRETTVTRYFLRFLLIFFNAISPSIPNNKE